MKRVAPAPIEARAPRPSTTFFTSVARRSRAEHRSTARGTRARDIAAGAHPPLARFLRNVEEAPAPRRSVAPRGRDRASFLEGNAPGIERRAGQPCKRRRPRRTVALLGDGLGLRRSPLVPRNMPRASLHGRGSGRARAARGERARRSRAGASSRREHVPSQGGHDLERGRTVEGGPRRSGRVPVAREATTLRRGRVRELARAAPRPCEGERVPVARVAATSRRGRVPSKRGCDLAKRTRPWLDKGGSATVRGWSSPFASSVAPFSRIEQRDGRCLRTAASWLARAVAARMDPAAQRAGVSPSLTRLPRLPVLRHHARRSQPIEARRPAPAGAGATGDDVSGVVTAVGLVSCSSFSSSFWRDASSPRSILLKSKVSGAGRPRCTPAACRPSARSPGTAGRPAWSTDG